MKNNFSDTNLINSYNFCLPEWQSQTIYCSCAVESRCHGDTYLPAMPCEGHGI